MAKTMVANISGARLRETERALAGLQGESAVNAFLEAHPHETKVLQQLVEWRRAGRPAPSLARLQRAMLWSDGTIEFSTLPGGEPVGPTPQAGSRRAGTRSGEPRTGGMRPVPAGGLPGGRQGGAAGPLPARPAASRPATGGAPATGAHGGARPGARPAVRPMPAGQRRPGQAARPGAPGFRRGGRGGDEGGAYGLPRSGEGWVLLREGETPPAESVALPPDAPGAQPAPAQPAPAQPAPAQQPVAAVEDATGLASNGRGGAPAAATQDDGWRDAGARAIRV